MTSKFTFYWLTCFQRGFSKWVHWLSNISSKIWISFHKNMLSLSVYYEMIQYILKYYILNKLYTKSRYLFITDLVLLPSHRNLLSSKSHMSATEAKNWLSLILSFQKRARARPTSSILSAVILPASSVHGCLMCQL